MHGDIRLLALLAPRRLPNKQYVRVADTSRSRINKSIFTRLESLIFLDRRGNIREFQRFDYRESAANDALQIAIKARCIFKRLINLLLAF